MANLVNILKDVISLIDLNLKVLSIQGNRIYVCRTLHVTLDKFVKDEFGNSYRVTAFIDNDWIEVEPFGHTNDFTGSIVVAPSITFLHGSPSSVNSEYKEVDQETAKKTPFIWLLEPYDTNDGDEDSILECSFSGRLFFMDEADEQAWENSEHNTNVIVPMENLKDAFKSVIEDSYSFRSTTSVSSRPRSRFGVVVTNKGSRSKIIEEDLSGLEVNIDLDLYDTNICKC